MSFKIPSRKAAIRIVDPTTGAEVAAVKHTTPDGAATHRSPPPHAQKGNARRNQDEPKTTNGLPLMKQTPPNDSTYAKSTLPVTISFSHENQRPLQMASVNQSNSVFGFNSTDWKPDINAPSYIPSYLWAIQQSPAMDKISKQISSIDFGAYIRSFAGALYLDPVPQIHPEFREVPVTISRHPRNLTPDSYFDYFSECLTLEGFSHSATLSPLVLFNTTLEPKNQQQHLYTLKVPGLRDNTPQLSLGDMVVVRQFFPFPQITQQGLEWVSNNQNGLNGSVAPGFNGIQIRSYVWGISKPTETVIIRVDGFFGSSKSCNVSFTLPLDSYVASWRAIQKISGTETHAANSYDSTPSARDKHGWIRRMLFPEEKHCLTQKDLPKGSFDRNWSDSQLNYEQQKAVDSVVSRNFGDLPFLISGVPGSGKTKTVVECALQLLDSTSDTTPHLLICAPSSPAADTLALRLSSHLKPHELFRLNGWNRTFAEVPDKLLPYTYTDNEVFSLPNFQMMMKYKIVVTTCNDADMLVQARLTNGDLMKLAYETISAISPSAQVKPEMLLHWTALIVDEAAQATEPSVCIPLTVVSNPLALDPQPGNKTSLPLFIMAGDEHQLAPRVYNSDTALSISLFERLFGRPIYADHPLSRRNAGPYKKLTKSLLPMPRPAFVNLTRNYRSHPAILAMPSVLFYNDTLIPCATPSHAQGPVPTWPEWRGRCGWPVLFNCNTSQDQVEDVLHHGPGTGVYNDAEAMIALRYTRSLLAHSTTIKYKNFSGPHGSKPRPKRIHQKEIAIITPFLAQVSHLRKIFRSHNLYDVNIGPLEAFQGLETRFLIICTTRTRSDQRFLDTDQSRALGLVGEKQRFNMAITRAKEGVVIIGNPNVLVGTGKDETWRAFLSFCARNGCWTVEPDADPSTRTTSDYWRKTLGGRNENEAGSATYYDITNVGYVSRLERGLLHADLLEEQDGEDGISFGDTPLENTRSNRRNFGTLREEEDYDAAAMWTAGLAAEEALRGSLEDEFFS
ncbi:predicted protein [Uncinocarpus reesii 1704]|uniref:Uncharacterized protein n=1 Tax=Uncinocarpus reesii (strain UAMH 1704) TaxID=336963 RepID=C4JWX3_UNCRE|nr:uncharacterized protein UREG_06146 [Uncinocarpus reesii 1704]EEP81281.1 predicted protein [Uncinocarpus reesii 1704]